MAAAEGTADAEDFDDLDNFDEDFETLPCSFTYIRICLVLPAVNGFLNAFLWPAYTLYFQEMGWPLVRAGLSITVGFGSRVLMQQMQLRTGYWLIVPLSAIHLVVVVLALVFQSNEWAVFLQIVAWLAIDPTCAIEGIAFDTFGASETLARQATSTVLSVFTIAFAFSCTFGGILYDLFSWTGLAMYHLILQGLMFFLLAVEPACRHSFMRVFFDPETGEPPKEGHLESGKAIFVAVVPVTENQLPSAVELQLEDVTEEDELKQPESQKQVEPAPSPSIASRHGETPEASPSTANRHDEKDSPIGRRMRGSQFTQVTVHTLGTSGTSGRGNPRAVERLHRARRVRTLDSDDSGHTAFTKNTAVTKGTSRTYRTGMSAMSRMTEMSKLSQAGQHFRHHFATSQAILPEIIGATGKDGVLREEIEDESSEGKDPLASKGASIPKDVRFPAFCIVLNSFCNTCAYILEYATFAIFFKEVHNWNEATFAGMTQMAGDVFGAIAMQLIPAVFGTGDTIDPEELGSFRRVLFFLVSKPYTLSLTLSTWVLFNLGMMSPWLPLAITAQVLMGTTFVYSCKWSTDMNLFYSLGDSKVFLSLQVLCRNADAIGGSVAGVLATWLFSLDPAAPFVLGTAMASVIFIIYTLGFCTRLGFGDDIETAEQKRSRRLGLKRVSSWKSTISTRKSTISTRKSRTDIKDIDSDSDQ